MATSNICKRDCIAVLRVAVLVAACAGARPAAAQYVEVATAQAEVAAESPSVVPLRKVADVFQVPRETDNLSFPVEIEGVVTLTVQESASFFLHDGQMGIHVTQRNGPRFKPGDRVKVIGDTRRGRYAPSIIPRKILLLGEGMFPEPRPATFSQMASGAMDSQWIEMNGVVCSVGLSADKHYVMVDLARDGGRLRAVVGSPLPSQPELLLDSEVRVRGVATGRFNPRGQMVEPLLRVPGSSWVTVIHSGPANPFALPIRTISRLMEFSPEGRPQHRVKVEGVVTRRFSDTTFFLRDDGHGLKVETRNPMTLQSGDHIEAVGFPIIANDEVVIQNAVHRKTGTDAAPAAVRSKVPALLNGAHASDLVSIQARLVDYVADGPSVTLILEAENHLFKGLLRRPHDDRWTKPEEGSLVDVTGICVLGEPGELLFHQPRSFLLLLAAPDDLRVLQSPPWWTTERLWRALLGTLALLAAGAGWVWALQRQVQRKRSVIEYQASHAAVLEERSRIARELHDTLEQGLTGLSLQLKAIETDLERTPHPVVSRLALFRQMLRQSRALARNAIRELRVDAGAPRRENFVRALSDAAEMWNRSGALSVKMNVTGESQPLPSDLEHGLIGIGIEALTNAVKHGHARSVQIDVTFGDGPIVLRIEDDGNGFDPVTIPGAAEGCFGLVGMRERARAIGAGISVESQPGHGTTILVEVPPVERAARPAPSDVQMPMPISTPSQPTREFS